MNKKFFIYALIFIILTSSMVGIFAISETYNYVRDDIVIRTCLSCIGMDPVTRSIWYWDNNPPDFIKYNLTKGPVFIGYRTTVCSACDDMDPILEDIFNVEFGPKDTVHELVQLYGNNITFFHFNLNIEKSGPFFNSFSHYDIDNRVAVPMFTIITLNNDSGIIKPYYITAYGKLGLSNKVSAQKDFFNTKMIEPAFEKHEKYIDQYDLSVIK